MKRWTILLFILCLLFRNESTAMHVAGAEITYQNVGKDKYEVTLRVYRDCNGLQVGNTPIYARCLGSSGSSSFNLSKISQRDISGYGKNCSVRSACAGGSGGFYGIEEHVWKGTVDLSSLNCCEVELSWNQCCRPSNYTTGMATEQVFTKSFLNKCVQPYNSSPQFTNAPVIFIASVQNYVFNMGAFDTIDKDEIYTYQLVKAYQSSAAPVTYNHPFTETRPLTFTAFPDNTAALPSGFHLHPTIGNLEFRPTRANESGTVAIEVSEWRKTKNGNVLVGQVQRDVGFFVVNYGSSRVPTLSVSDSNFACVGKQFCLDITTADANNSDTVTLSFNNPIRGSTFTTNSGSVRLASSKFCWTPTESDLRDEPYIFTATATDNGCPINGKAIRGYAVFVGQQPGATITIDTLSCGRIAVNYTLDSIAKTIKGLRTQWLVLDSLGRSRYRGDKKLDTLKGMGGMNIVMLRLITPNRCTEEITDTVYFNHLPQLRLSNDTTICAGYFTEIKAFTNGGYPPYAFRWSTSVNDTIDRIKITARFDTAFWAELSDLGGCTFRDSVRVKTWPSPVFDIGGPYQLCVGDTLHLVADTGYATYTWSNGSKNLEASFTKSGTIWLQIKSLNGCESRDSTFLTVNPLPAVNLGSDRLVCDADSLVLSSNIQNADNRWSTGDSGEFITIKTNGKYKLAVTDSNGCYNVDSVLVRFGIAPQVNLGTDGILCAGENRILQASAPGLPHRYRWHDGANTRTKIANKGGTYWVVVTDTAGCAASDTIVLGYFDFSYTLSTNQSIMEGDFVSLKAGNVKNAQWFDSADTSRVLITDTVFSFTAEKPQLLLVRIYSDSAGTICQKFDTVIVAVNTRPRISAPAITPVCEGEEICIEIETSDLNPADSVKLNLADGPFGAVFTIKNPNARLPKATLCWDAPMISKGDSLVSYTLRVEDNGSPRPNNVIQRFGIQINAQPQISPVVTRLECNTFQLDWTLLKVPADSIFKAQWEIKDNIGQVAAVRNNKPDTVMLPRGRYVAGLNVESNAGCKATASGNLESLCDGVGINSIKADDITIYPNPAYDEVWIKIPGCVAPEIKVFDLGGRQVEIKAIQRGEGEWLMNVADLTKGVYMINVLCNERLYNAKLLIF